MCASNLVLINPWDVDADVSLKFKSGRFHAAFCNAFGPTGFLIHEEMVQSVMKNSRTQILSVGGINLHVFIDI